jgi:hypothetical protein
MVDAGLCCACDSRLSDGAAHEQLRTATLADRLVSPSDTELDYVKSARRCEQSARMSR